MTTAIHYYYYYYYAEVDDCISAKPLSKGVRRSAGRPSGPMSGRRECRLNGLLSVSSCLFV